VVIELTKRCGILKIIGMLYKHLQLHENDMLVSYIEYAKFPSQKPLNENHLCQNVRAPLGPSFINGIQIIHVMIIQILKKKMIYQIFIKHTYWTAMTRFFFLIIKKKMCDFLEVMNEKEKIGWVLNLMWWINVSPIYPCYAHATLYVDKVARFSFLVKR